MTPATRARALADVGRLADAESEVRRALAETPADPDLLTLLAGLLRLQTSAAQTGAAQTSAGRNIAGQNRAAEALAVAQAAVAVAPHLPGTHIELAECLLLAPAHEKSSLQNQKAATPNSAGTSHSDAALRAAEEAVRLDPTHPPAYRVLARVHDQRRDFPRARDAAHRALALNPRSIPDLLTLGEIERHAGRRKPAREAIGKALAQDPDNPDGRWLIALLDAERLRVRSSMRSLRELAADHPARLDTTALTWPVRGLLSGFRRGLGAGVPLVAVLALGAYPWPSWQIAARAAAVTVVLVMIGFGLRVLIPAGLLPWRCVTLLPARTRRAVRTGWVAAGATVTLLLGYALTAHWPPLIAAFAALALLMATGRSDRT
ncbi:putative Zn-dependent protease [Actinoplanes lutulentus]|uniref:Tetratricopeptide repeat protein n=1 Tax=Actinoplanes lutulentus TaxID=1287878 RepID=A0A327Z7C0_9ACTN|nr:tetratricopeptide repeat protein [Actinoplanes lutulentus]MBB2943679.1 putative Zn-dependent protease [Actinoplanes lutulentus]RAK29224.1 tetratricopeptide repeat protein [Actinoplanes lutulentus]